MLTKMNSLSVLFIGKTRPDHELIQQSLSDGFHCPVFFDFVANISLFDYWKIYNNYDIILVDNDMERLHTPDFRNRVISIGIPVIFLMDTLDIATARALIVEGAEACVAGKDPVQLFSAVCQTMKHRVIPKRSSSVPLSNDKDVFVREILNNLNDAFFVVDSDWNISYVNNKAESCWGCSRDNLLGKSMWDIMPYINNTTEKDKYLTAMTKRISMQWEASSIDKEFWLDIRVYPIRDSGLAVVFREITEKKHAEEVLRLSRDKQAVMLKLSDSLRQLSNPGDIHEAASRIIGEYLRADKAFYCDVVTVDGVDYFSLDKLYSATDEDVILGLHAIDSPGVLASENFEGRNIVVCDMETDPRIDDDIRPSLRQFKLGAWVSVPLIRNGRFVASFTVHQPTPRNWTPEEISLIEETTARTWAEVDRVRAETALRKSEQHALKLVSELENADRNKNEFINALSHELRNPLASITASLTMLDLLDRNHVTKKPKEIIKRQTDQLCRLVDDLLDLTRISNNKIQLDLEVFDLNELAQSAAYDHRTLFEDKGLALTTEIGDIPLNIKADPVRISQIIGNLLHNASKFTKKGGETALIVRRQEHEALIIVKDNGIGFAPTFLPELFKTFRQAEPNKGGLGLGLSIVKGIAEAHGGTVSAESGGLNQGAVFTVRLPLPTNFMISEAAEMKTEEHRTKPLKILLIDDNRDLAEITCSLLTLYGYEVWAAYSGTSGIQKALENRPNVIICDIGLPDLDGYEVARRIYDGGELPEVIMISLSGYAQASDFEYSKQAGFRLHISKPVDFENLKSILDTIVL